MSLSSSVALSSKLTEVSCKIVKFISSTTGGVLTRTVNVSVSVSPLSSVTVSVMVYVPAVAMFAVVVSPLNVKGIVLSVQA